MALRDYYKELSDKEREEPGEFASVGCWLMRKRFLGREVYEALDFDVERCLEISENSEITKAFRPHLFSRIVACVKCSGLWGEEVEKWYAEMGVLDMAGFNLDELMKADEDYAEQIDREKQEFAARAAEVDEAIALGASA